MRYSDTQLNLTSWEEYLEREIELIPISEKIIKINISNIAPKNLSESIKRFEILIITEVLSSFKFSR